MNTKFVYRIMILLTTLALILAACAPAAPAPQPPSEPPTLLDQPTEPPAPLDLNALYDVQWALAAYGDPASPTVLPQNLPITAVFTADGQLSGLAGCNNYNTSFTAGTDGAMQISPEIAATRMMCPEEQMQAEAAYLKALEEIQSFSYTPEGNLALQYESDLNQVGLLIFLKGAVPLTNTHWVLVSYGDPAAPTAALPGVPVTAVFSEEDQVSGSAGCNGYNAAYSVNGADLSISPTASTMMFCAAGMEQEAAYLAALTGAQSYQITGQKLEIQYVVDGIPGLLTFSSASLPLVYTLWRLAAVDGEPTPAETAITAVFKPGEEPDSNTVSGLAACNNYTGPYTQDGDSLMIGPLATTFMLCDEALNKAEQSYLAALQATQSYQIFGDVLMLTTEIGTLAFQAERTPLEAALWQLVSLGDRENPVAPVEGANFTAQFTRQPGAPSGALHGTTGCNEYAAGYAATINALKINPPASTGSQTCVPGLTSQEQLYFLALSDATQYTILGNDLVIPYDDNKQALVFRGTQLDLAERPTESLDGSYWYLWSMNDQPTLAGATITARVAVNDGGAGGELTGSAGCNTYLAEFGGSLSVETTLTSGVSCSSPAGVMEQEQKYIAALGRAYGFWQTGDQLIVNSGLGVLTYRTSPPPESSDQRHLLVGQNWFLVSFNTSYSQPGTREPFTIFNSNGTLNGNTGCNDFNGSYTTNINQITISGVASTKAACPDAALQSQESAMLAVLGSAQTYLVVENTLQISGSQGVLGYSLTPLTRPEEIVVPNPIITAPTIAQVNTAITFDARATTSQAPIARFSWEFGDGGRATGAVVQHVYTAPGTYRVLMTAIDQRDAAATTSMNITIVTPAQPTPLPTATPLPAPTEGPQPTATTQPPAPTEGPQPTATTQPPAPTDAPKPTAVPTQAPEPTAAPTAVPPTPEPTQPPAAPPTAAISGPSRGFIGEPVSFSAAGSTPGSSPIANYQFAFGDGASSGPTGSPQVEYLYRSGGNYQVTVTVTDENGLSSSASLNITIDARLDTVVWSLQDTRPGTVITLQFLNGQIAGFAGCNTYNGSYSATDNGDGTYSVTASGFSQGQIACPAEVMAQEQSYLAALQGVTTAQLSGGTLVLNHSGGALRFAEVR